MILALFLSVLITFSSCSSSAVKKSQSNLDNIPRDCILLVSEYLRCPQKELGFLNKELYRLFFIERPFSRVLADRFGIPELLGAQSGDGFGFLSKLSHVKGNPVHILRCAAEVLADRQIFGRNLSLFIRFVDRFFREFTIFELSLREQKDLTRSLLENKEYDLLVEIMLIYPHPIKYTFSVCRMKTAEILMGKIVEPSESLIKKLQLVFGSSDELGKKLYTHFFYLFEDIDAKANFIVSSIVANIPEEFYIDLILSEGAGILRATLFISIFVRSEIFKSSEDSKRIHDTLAGILGRIPKRPSVRYYTLLNTIRFGAEVDYEHIEREFNEMNLGQVEKFRSFLAAGMAKKHEIVAGIYRASVGDVDFNLVNYSSQRMTGIYAFVSLLENLSEPERQVLLNNASVLEYFLIFFAFKDFHFDPATSKHCFSLRPKVKETDFHESGLGLPETFLYDIKHNNEGESRAQFMLNRIVPVIFIDLDHDEASVLALFEGFVEHEETRQLLYFFGEDNPIKASAEVLKAISGNDRLMAIVQEFGIKFELAIFKQSAILFKNSVENLAGILLNVTPINILNRLKTPKQLRNFEEFAGRSVAEMFITDIINGNSGDLFYSYRPVLLYWLNGPHRERLLELKSSAADLLEKLALELDLADSKFLLENEPAAHNNDVEEH